MKLITKQIERKLEKTPLYSTDGVELVDKNILVKFFTPWGCGSWFVFEAERQDDGDWRFFGYVESPLGSDCNEMGYFTMSQLTELRGPMGLTIERDLYGPKKMTEVLS